MRIKTPCVISLLLLLSACEKREFVEPETSVPVTSNLTPGLPETPHVINGYMYSSFRLTRFGWNYSSNITASAYFGEPRRNLMVNFNHLTDNQSFISNNKNTPNVSVGRVIFDDLGIGGTNTISYWASKSIDTVFFDTPPNWDIEGNKTFVPANVTLQVRPHLLKTSHDFSLQISTGYTVDLEPLISNYDSAGIYIHYNSAFPPIYKSCPKGSHTITFTSKELGNLKNRSTCNIVLMGFNYSHQLLADKLYIFESSSKLERQLTIKQ